MMLELDPQMVEAAQQLMGSDVDNLYVTLGMRAGAMATDPAVAGSYAPPVTYDGDAMGPLEDLKEAGRKLLQRWDKAAYDLLCGTDDDAKKDREKLAAAFGVGNDAVIAAAITGALVAHWALAPAIAAVIGVLVVKRFLPPAYQTLCELWHQELPGD